ncbi:MAG: hypothetical protein ACI8Z7_000089 [Candidatus Nanohaloarchaea archaeon]|jgi:hypothetical protein
MEKASKLTRKFLLTTILLLTVFVLSAVLIYLELYFLPKVYLALIWLGSLYFLFWSSAFLLILDFYNSEKKEYVIDYLKKVIPGIGTGFGVAVALELKGADVLSKEYLINLAPVIFVFIFFIVATGKMYIFLLELENENREEKA